jgi:hypothetical protein
MGRAEVRRYYEDNTRRDALHAVDRRIAELLTPLTPRHLLDLGCGTGASALWLAGEQAAARGLTGHCRSLETDYLHIPELDPADAAYAIESFTHAETQGLFFAAQRRLLPLVPLLGTAARSSLSGGTVLQICLLRGWVRYRFLVFQLEKG